MKNNYWFVLLFLCLICIFLPPASAQVIDGCAASRLYTEARSAIASPKHVKRMNRYDMTFYGLDLQLERNSVFIAGTVTLEAKPTVARLDTFAFELHPNFQISSVVINGVPQQTIIRNDGDVSVKLLTPIQAPAKVKAEITYSGLAPQSASAAIGNGFTSSLEPTFNKRVTWSLSEPYAAYEWWPTKQVLTDKADSVHVFVTTSAENKVGSNGLLTRTIDIPNDKKRYEWKSNYPIAYYLVSVAVSDYTEYLIYANPAGAASPVPILNYVYSNEALDRFREQINLTAPFLEYYSDIFTLYPFHKEKYGHSMAPMGGGMEHQTMTTQATFTFTLTAHELAHQWFGNNVTCASWRDIWLNEGFASYAEYLALQQFKPQDASGWMLSAHEFALDAPNGSVLVKDTTDVSRIFNYRLTYKKAAAVVHMLRNEINNDALFFESLRNYQRQYQDSTATTADLQRVFEETTGMDLDYFFEQWLAGSGYPVFAVEWNQKGQNVLLVSRQSTSGGTSFFKTTMEYRIRTGSIDTTIRVAHNKPVEQYLIKLRNDDPVGDVIVDPHNWVLNETLRVVQNPALHVPDQLETNPVLFPNPAYATLKVVDVPFQATTAILYDRIGRRLWQERFQETNEVQVDVRNLLPGLYILHLSDGRSHYRTSFIKVDRP